MNIIKSQNPEEINVYEKPVLRDPTALMARFNC
jgi:hypothetical protein